MLLHSLTLDPTVVNSTRPFSRTAPTASDKPIAVARRIRRMGAALLLAVSAIATAAANPAAAQPTFNDVVRGMEALGGLIRDLQQGQPRTIVVVPAPQAAPAGCSQPEMDRATRMIVQDSLNRLGFSAGAVDGDIGPSSRAAISRFQDAVNHPATGCLTFEQLTFLVAIQNGDAGPNVIAALTAPGTAAAGPDGVPANLGNLVGPPQGAVPDPAAGPLPEPAPPATTEGAPAGNTTLETDLANLLGRQPAGEAAPAAGAAPEPAPPATNEGAPAGNTTLEADLANLLGRQPAEQPAAAAPPEVAAADPLAGKVVPASAAIDLGAGVELAGDLSPTDPAMADGSRFDCYAITGAPGTTFTVRLTSAAFDPYLVAGIAEGCGNVPGDLTAGGAGVRIAEFELTVPADGRYYVLANSFAPDATGAYRIALIAAAPTFDHERAAPAPAGMALAPSPTVTECDRAAADPLDPDAIAPGVAPDDVNEPVAVAACREAVTADPQNPRLIYQYGRALFLADRDTESNFQYAVAASYGYSAAFAALGANSFRANRDQEAAAYIADALDANPGNCLAVFTAAGLFGQNTTDAESQVMARLILVRAEEVCPADAYVQRMLTSAVNATEVTLLSLGIVDYLARRAGLGDLCRETLVPVC